MVMSKVLYVFYMHTCFHFVATRQELLIHAGCITQLSR